jgi:hypothetical protein
MPARSIAAFVLTTLLVSVASPWAYAAPPKKPVKLTAADAASADSATITVSSLTRGAKVFVNDAEVGEVPLPAPLRVKAGETYAIRVQKRGYAPYVDTVMAGAGQDSQVDADLVPTMGVLRINCNVLRARVTLAGKPIGMTPFDGDVPPGKHELRIAATGYLLETQELTVEAGQEQTLDITLAAVPVPAVVEDKSIFARWWFWTAVGAVVVGGVTAGVVASQGAKHVPAGDPDARIQLP